MLNQRAAADCSKSSVDALDGRKRALRKGSRRVDVGNPI